MRRHLRRNVLALGADFALYTVGLAFASQSTLLPAFAASLGAPNIVIGAIPAVTTLGWLLPSLFVAGHTETLGRKLPFVLRYTVWERAPYLALALTAFVVAPDLSREEILRALRERIDPVFLPRPLHRVAALPRNATGKLPYEALLQLARDLKREA